MTNSQVDEMEGKLREAQELVEESGRMICGERGEEYSRIWGTLTSLANDIGDVIGVLWKIRPEE